MIELGSVATWVGMIFSGLVFAWKKIRKWRKKSRKAKQCAPAESAAAFRAPDAEEARMPKTFEEAPKATHPEPEMMQMITSASFRAPDASNFTSTATGNPYAANLKAKCEIMEEIGVLKFTIENFGPKDVFIDYIEMCVRHNGQYRCKPIESGKGLEELPKPLHLLEYHPPAQSQADPTVLESGDICHRRVSLYCDENVGFALEDFIRNAEEAKTVQFVVCAGNKQFPVKSDPAAIAAIADLALQKQ